MKSCTIADLADGLDQSIGRPMHSTQLNSTMESAECTGVHCTMYNVQCTASIMYSVHYAGSGNEDDRNDTVSRVIKQARSRRISVALRHDLDLYFVFNVIFICICAGIICICNIIPICIPICICICICRNDRVRRVIKQAGRISIALGRDLDAPSVAPTWRTLRAP